MYTTAQHINMALILKLIQFAEHTHTHTHMNYIGSITFTGCHDCNKSLKYTVAIIFTESCHVYYITTLCVCKVYTGNTHLNYSLTEELPLISVLQSRHGFSFLKAADHLISVYQVKQIHCWTCNHSDVYSFAVFIYIYIFLYLSIYIYIYEL